MILSVYRCRHWRAAVGAHCCCCCFCAFVFSDWCAFCIFCVRRFQQNFADTNPCAAAPVRQDSIHWDLTETVQKLRQRNISSCSLVEALLARYTQLQWLNAFVTVQFDTVRTQAAHADLLLSTLSKSEIDALPLLGAPIAIKDNFITKDMPATGTSG